MEVDQQNLTEDQARILAVFNNPNHPDKVTQAAVLELLQSWTIHANAELLTALENAIIRDKEITLSTHSETMMPDALYHLLFHEKAELRIWAQAASKGHSLGAEQAKRLQALFASAFYHLAQDSPHQAERIGLILEGNLSVGRLSTNNGVLWKALATLLSRCDDAAIEAALLQSEPLKGLSCNLLSEKLSTTEDCLRPCLAILSRLGVVNSFWSTGEAHFAQAVICALASNENLHRFLENVEGQEVEVVFGWLPGLVQVWMRRWPQHLKDLLEILEGWNKVIRTQAVYDACFREVILILASLESLEEGRVPHVRILNFVAKRSVFSSPSKISSLFFFFFFPWRVLSSTLLFLPVLFQFFSETSDAALKNSAFHLLARCLATDALDSSQFYKATLAFLYWENQKPSHKQNLKLWPSFDNPKYVEGLASLSPPVSPRSKCIDLLLLSFLILLQPPPRVFAQGVPPVVLLFAPDGNG